MKQFIAAVVFVCVASTVFAGENFVIGCSNREFSDKWMSYVMDGIDKFDKEHDDVTVIYTDAKSDPALQVSQVETMITQGVNGITLSPADPDSMRAIIPMVKEAKVPINLINAYPEEDILEGIDGFVGTNSKEAGIMQGEWLVKNVPQGGNVGIMMGMLVHEAAQMRTAGIKEFLADYPQFKIVAEAEGSWDRNKGLQIAENWLQSDANITIFACNNDEMAIGAVLACRSMGIKDEDVYILGVDGTSDGLEFLGEGLDMTLYQNPIVIGYESVKQIYDILKGRPVEKVHWVSHELILPDNKADYQ
jgi:inositol transport system substrate-binding protein